MGKPAIGSKTELDGLQSSKQPTNVISERLLSVIFAAVLVVILGLYDSRLSHYPLEVTLFPRIIGLPTLVLAITYLVKELLKLAKSTQDVKSPNEYSNAAKVAISQPGSAQSSAKGSVELVGRTQPMNPPAQVRHTRTVGLGLAVSLAVLYVALLGFLGFLIDSVALVVFGPILFGQSIRTVPVLFVVGTSLAVILSVLVHLSGVIPLSTGIFHIGVS